MGDIIAGVLVAKVLKTSDPSHSAVIYRVFRHWTAHDGCQGQEERETHLHLILQPNLVVDDEGVHAQVLLDGLQALDHGVSTLHCPWCTVQLSTDHQLRMGQRNWF